jgi:protease IV
MELQQSRTFSYVFIGLIALSLVVGGIVAAIKSNAPAKEPTSTAAAQATEAGKKAARALKGDHIALIHLEGEISSDTEGGGFIEDESHALRARKALDEVADDDKAKGVILLINSPGGTVGMSQELNAAVKRVRAKKPIVASLLDVAASGGYYTACATDRIITNPGTLTASIGVIMQTLNMQQLFNEKLGITSTTITSGKFKDILNPYRKTRPDEVALLQAIIDDSYGDFLNAVLDGRLRHVKGEAAKAERAARIKAVADGRVVTGNQAVAAGLADEVGDLETAKAAVQKLINAKFGYSDKTKLPLEEFEGNEAVFEFMGIPLGSLQQLPLGWLQAVALLKQGASVQASPLAAAPMAVRYANQPLWLYQ